MRVGFIGFGKMAEAMYQGMQVAELWESACVVEHSEQRLVDIKQSYGLEGVTLQDCVASSDVVFFCVKPQQIDGILDQCKDVAPQDKMWVSILAGTPISVFENANADMAVCRVMPNTPALVGEGMLAWVANSAVTDTQKKWLSDIFSACGESMEFAEESAMDVVTGISGSGPAFLYQLADAIASEGVAQGLDYDQALGLISQTMIGAGLMMQASERSPKELISDVSSPNGTTVAGLTKMSDTSITEDIKAVVRAAIDRSRALGET
ncbi:pyrroline-5-carboxylate reductase [bacterium]|jgi:pyrroline-5-carboxylate reductase|nr:pyrroline-5-carboxylate reductase [bacterium]